MLSNPVFATPGARHAIDVCRIIPDVGYVGIYSGHTLDQTRQRYPDAQVMESEEVESANESYYLTQPVREISRATYHEMLDCLPPCYRSSDAGNESFQMSELTTGRITEALCRIGQRFFRFYVTIGTPHRDIINRAAIFMAGGKQFVVVANPGFDREEPVAEFDTEAEALKYVLRNPHDGLDVTMRA
jgi:hypothetical protein